MASSNQTVMTHQFSQVPSVEIPRSSFDRSHGLKTTFDASGLIPILCDEALPGDTFNLKMSAFARLATPIFPIMDNLFMETFFFAVPYRLVWDNWQKFNGEQTNPGDSTDFLVPTVTSPPVTGFLPETIYDYMGIPPNHPDMVVDSLHLRAYNLIYNEWFRDQNLIDSIPQNTDDGPDLNTDYIIRNRNKRHDYFTSCLPWPQKGDPVSVPLGLSAPVISTGDNIPEFGLGGNTGVILQSDQSTQDAVYNQTAGSVQALYWDETKLITDLTDATAVTINALRQGFQIQRMLERDARGGTRYTEIIRAHFGVVSPDARLQRPEFLGGGSSPIIISPVASTVPTDLDETTPQATLAAIGTVSLNNHGFTKSFTEHCIIIGLVSVRADLTYQQGLDRMWSRQTRFDYYWPALSHLGEQAVLRKELYATGVKADDEIVFGYQERFAEYRYKQSLITAQFRSDFPLTLDAWHLSQSFGPPPVLSEGFIEENVPVDRVIAIPASPHFIFDSYFQMRCARPMPLYGVPGLIDHF